MLLVVLGFVVVHVGDRLFVLEHRPADDIPHEDTVRPGVNRHVLYKLALQIADRIFIDRAARPAQFYRNAFEFIEVPPRPVSEPPHDPVFLPAENRGREHLALFNKFVRQVFLIYAYRKSRWVARDLKEGVANLTIDFTVIDRAYDI